MKKLKSKTKKGNRFLETINIVLFFIFLVLLPTQLGKHFFLPFSYLSGIRVDYLSPTLYLVDLIVVALSVLNFKTVIAFFRNKVFLYTAIALAVNVAFSKSPPLAVYGGVRLMEFFVVIAVSGKVAGKLSSLAVLAALFVSGVFELGLSVVQIALKHSVQGPLYYLGERLMSLGTPGIAKIAVGGQEYLRPYGTFSHPNSMGGFFLLLYIFVLTAKKFERHVLLKYMSLFVFACLVFLSFSKTAILVFLVANFAYYFLNRKGLCKICVISRLLVLTVLSLVFLIPAGDPMTLLKRVELAGNSIEVIKSHWLTGVGLNNYLLAQSAFRSNFPLFLNQPVHNIFLLFLSETGLIGAAAIYYLWIFLNKSLSKNQWLLVGVVVLTGMVDHYWLTLIQNLILVGVVTGITGFRGRVSPGGSKPRSDEVARQIL